MFHCGFGNVLNNDIYIEKSISCMAALNFLTAKGFKLWEKTFQHIINQLLNFEILEFWGLHLPQLTRNCSNMNGQVGYLELDQLTTYSNSDKNATMSGALTIFLEQKLSVSLPRIASSEVVRCSVRLRKWHSESGR